jgi:hypothetical protein
MRCVRADLAAAPIVRVALLAAAQLPRLVLKVAAIVDQIAHALQRQADASVAAIKFRFRVAGEDDWFVIYMETIINNRVVDPDWIRIQRLCGSGSVLGIRIKKNKKFQWKNALFSYLKKKFTTEKLQNSTTF